MSLMTKARSILATFPTARVADIDNQTETARGSCCRVPGPAITVESVSIIAGGDGAKTDARTPADIGVSLWSAVADNHREHILARLDALPPASNDDGRRLLVTTRSFLETEHWQTAVALGWSPVELFGIDPYAPLSCLDGQGLVPGLALSRLNGGYLENIAEDQAAIRCRSGSLLTYRRGSVGFDDAVLWWECPALIGSSEDAQ